MPKITPQHKRGFLKWFKDDITKFGEFIFEGTHITEKIPDFHKNIYEILKGEEDKVAIAAPRGHAKSTIIDLIYLLHCIAYKKASFILLISDTYSQATLQLETLKVELESNERFKFLFGNLVTDKWAEGNIELKGHIKVMALGSGQKVRGLKYINTRPDLVILDDLENEEMVQTKEQREKLERWFNGALVPALAKKSRMIYIGTILHYDSLLNKILDEDKYVDWDKHMYKAIQEDGTALWPEHLSIEELTEIKDNYVNNGLGHLFYAEYMNEPKDAEMQFFRRDDWRYYSDEDLKGKQKMNVYTTVDLAISRDKRADFTTMVTVGVDQDNFWYVLDVKRQHWGPKEIVDNLFITYEQFSPMTMGIEDTIEYKTLIPYMEEEMRKRQTFLPIQPVKPLGSKKQSPNRIRGLEPLYRSHTILHKENDTMTRVLEDELYTFPNGRHDDVIDALAYILHIYKVPPQYMEQSLNYETFDDSNTNEYTGY